MKPAGSKPASPARVPSKAGGRLSKGRAIDLSSSNICRDDRAPVRLLTRMLKAPTVPIRVAKAKICILLYHLSQTNLRSLTGHTARERTRVMTFRFPGFPGFPGGFPGFPVSQVSRFPGFRFPSPGSPGSGSPG